MSAPPGGGEPKRSLRHRLYHGETAYDFVGRRRVWFLVSGLVILAGVVSLLTQGLNYGIDFKGGTSWEVEAPEVSVAQARDAVAPVGLGDAKIQKVQSQGADDRIRVQGPRFEGTAEEISTKQAEVTDKLARLAGTEPGQVSVNDVGPSWGKDVTKKARNALVVFFVLISIYIWLRFEWKMAVAALSAVVHDIFVTVGVYSISRFEVTPATVVAFLTILGYSLYDTIVVFDKVEENSKGASAGSRLTYSDIVNLSMNQVLMRSINTSLVAILPILSVLVVGAGFLGAAILKDFGLALLVGLLTGAYSSIFIAAPVLAALKEREPRYKAIRVRAESRGGGSGLLTPAAAAAGRGRAGRSASDGAEDAEESDVVPARAGGGASTATGHTAKGSTATGRPRPRPQQRNAPRPRKKGKRR